MRCSNCGSENPPGSRFCGDCGVPLEDGAPVLSPEARGPLPGERRHLTVLFCDLVNSTSIATQLDPEEWREVVASYHSTAAQAIERFGGHIAQYLGDGVMAYFGWPAAHENDAERAARAGLAILESISRLDEKLVSAKLAARVGIHSGAVVVGAGVGKNADVFGDTPNIAARVQAAALPDTVLTTADTHRLISGLFVVEDCGTQTLKGIGRPIQLFRVIQPSGVRGRFEAVAAARGLTPFVGREEELRLLMNRWECTLAGEGQVVLIIGEAGIGKSRLVQHFHEQIAGTRHVWVEVSASPFFQNTPFYPVPDMIRGLLRDYGDKSGGVGEVAVQQRSRRRTSPISTAGPNGQAANAAFARKEEQLGGLESGLDLELDAPPIARFFLASAPMEDPASPLASRQQRRRLLSTLVEWVLGAAEVVPVAIAIENLHWADPSTRELIELLIERCAKAPLLLLFTARTEFRADWQPLVPPHVVRIVLNPLNSSSARTLVKKVAGEQTLSEETITTVVQRAGGVPLFVEELTRTVLENGAKHAGVSVPATLHDSLMARLDRLGAVRETLQLCAVLGIEFTHEFLLAFSSLNEGELQRHLLALTEAELLHARGLAPNVSYQFKHALIRDAAYEALLKSRRRELHTRIAQTIEHRFPEQAASRPETLAYHYTEAGLITQAVENWRNAGRAAIVRSAHAEAIAHLRRGLDLLQWIPEGRRSQAELELQIHLAVGLVGIKGWHDSEVGAAYQRAYELWRGNDDDPSYFSILFGLWMNRLVRAEHREARGYAEQLVRIAPRVSEPGLQVQAYWALGCGQFYMGDFDRAHASFRRVIDFYDRDKHRSVAFRFGQDPCMSSMVLESHVLWLLGYSEQSSAMDALAISLARSLKHPFTMAWCLAMLAMEDIEKRDFSRADERLGEGILLSRDCGFSDVETNLHDLRTIRLLLEGAVPQVRADARSASRTRTEQGKGLHHPYGYTESAEALGRAKRFDKALPAVELALKLIDQTGERYWEAEARRILGDLLMAQPLAYDRTALKQAESSFRRAIEIAREQNARTLELRATISLARLLGNEGRRGEAHEKLAAIYNWFTEGFDTADLKQAKALLDELSS